MYNVLIITSGVTAGGVDTLILNTLSVMDRNKFHIDIMIFDDSKDDWAFKFKKYGCNIIKVDRARKQGVYKAIKKYRTIIKQGKYDIVHSHIGFGSVLPVIACVGLKNSRIITHAHFDNFEAGKLTQMLGHILFNIFPCKKLACSYGAGLALYGKYSKFLFVKNGIDSEKFAYNENTRNQIREELGITSDTFVVGTVGRMQYQKNHEFLINIFNDIKSKNPNSKLFLVGDGELHEKIQKQVDEFGLHNDVIFLGIRNDVDRILQGLDVFIMPTRFEGLSLALLEVECAGLPCLTTDVVPKEAKVTSNFHFLSLNDTPQQWADIALKYKNSERSNGLKKIEKCGFDKVSAAKAWFEIYENLINDM